MKKKKQGEYIQDLDMRVVSIRDITGFIVCHYSNKWGDGNIFYLCAVTGAKLPYVDKIYHSFLKPDEDPEKQLSELKQIKVYHRFNETDADTISIQGIYVIDKVVLDGHLPEAIDFQDLLMDAMIMWLPTVLDIANIHNQLIQENLYLPDIDHSQSRFFGVNNVYDIEGVEYDNGD